MTKQYPDGTVAVDGLDLEVPAGQTMVLVGPSASLIAAYFIVSYAAFSIPVVAAGVATAHFRLHRTALAYCTVIAALAAAAAGSQIFRSRSAA